MGTWKSINEQIETLGGGHDVVRRDYLAQLFKRTNRNVIAYYSGWLQRGGRSNQGLPFGINDNDKNAFMATINKLDRKLGLDLILHTPGGEVAATESLISYLRNVFGTNIRAIVPQLAMSAGTMLALSCRSIMLGKHSDLGPFDPQIGGMPAHSIIAEFDFAVDYIKNKPHSLELWQSILGKLSPTHITSAQHAMAMADEIVKKSLTTGMFEGDADADAKAKKIVDFLGTPEKTRMHDRHVSREKAVELGIKVEEMETDQDLQDLILSIHHAFCYTMSSGDTFKLTENHLGIGYAQKA